MSTQYDYTRDQRRQMFEIKEMFCWIHGDISSVTHFTLVRIGQGKRNRFQPTVNHCSYQSTSTFFNCADTLYRNVETMVSVKKMFIQH